MREQKNCGSAVEKVAGGEKRIKKQIKILSKAHEHCKLQRKALKSLGKSNTSAPTYHWHWHRDKRRKF